MYFKKECLESKNELLDIFLNGSRNKCINTSKINKQLRNKEDKKMENGK